MKNSIIEHANPVSRRWLSPAEAALYLGCSKGFLDKDRGQLRRMPFAKLGKSVKYDLADLDAYLESTKATPLANNKSGEDAR